MQVRGDTNLGGDIAGKEKCRFVETRTWAEKRDNATSPAGDVAGKVALKPYFYKKNRMAFILIIPMLVLIADGFLAHWIVKKYVRFSTPIKNEKLWRGIITTMLFLAFAAITLYLLIINFRFER